jgi:hypothetical protein
VKIQLTFFFKKKKKKKKNTCLFGNFWFCVSQSDDHPSIHPSLSIHSGIRKEVEKTGDHHHPLGKI